MSCSDCVIQETAADFFRKLRAVEWDHPCMPLSGSMDWTYRCSVRCRHCFACFPGASREELTTSRMKKILDELAAAGVLFLVVTGGEPLTRPDFKEIYSYAKSKGFILTLFTNATLIDEAMAAFLADLPPRRIEVTIYGHTEKTYEAVTATPGSFRRFRQGVDALLRHGLLLRLKTMLLTANSHEFEEMKSWAGSLGCDFRYDALIHGRINSDLAPTGYRLSPEEIVNLQFSQTDDKAEFIDYLKKPGIDLPPKQTLFECGAGVMTLHVDAYGNAHPCMLWREDPYDLVNGSLDEGWMSHIRNIRARPAPEGECTSCSDRVLCSCCPPIALIETGSAVKASPFYCRLAAERKRQCLLNA